MIHTTQDGWTLYQGDCREVVPTLEPVDAVITDPPYGLEFMGSGWDRGVPGVEFWEAIAGAMKPGAHLLAFGGTRTFHRLTCAIEDAGFEIRDCLMWVYGSGFPKSLDVSKAIDKAAGVEREVVGHKAGHGRSSTLSREKQAEQGYRPGGASFGEHDGTGRAPMTAPATPDAERWQGWGTALKPAWEPIILARKPFKGTVAGNVLEHGTGAINVDGCRVGDGGATKRSGQAVYPKNTNGTEDRSVCRARTGHTVEQIAQGRWPANLIHDGSDEVVGLFPVVSSGKPGIKHGGNTGSAYGKESRKPGTQMPGYGDSGSAARFFYCAKASKADRDEGCDGLGERPARHAYGDGLNTETKVRTAEQEKSGVDRDKRKNTHPTVKPTALMRYLCRLVTPPGGTVLDPFMGSGSTGKAARLEGFNFIGIELDADYCEIAARRIAAAEPEPIQAALPL